MRHELVQTQTQKLTLTAKMQESLHILQYSGIELMEFVKQQTDENPALEFEYDPNAAYWGAAPKGNSRFDADYDPVAVARDTSSDTLERHLLHQLNCLVGISSPELYEAAAYIIGNLDGNGYLTLGLDKIVCDLRTAECKVEQALSLVQGLDPAGTGARTLRECLLLQLDRKQLQGSLVYRLADRYLEELAARRLTRIAKELKVTIFDIQEAASLLKQLDPRPGSVFQKEEPRYIVPDVLIEPGNGDKWIVRISRAVSESVSVNGYYLRMSEAAAGTGDMQFVKDKISSAQWLIKCLSQRETTLQLVTEAIVERQSGFFRKGRAYLAPLTMKEVADRIGMHESTISRSVMGKYAQTPQGVFELKYFFSSGIQGSEGTFASAEAVKEKIREILKAETSAKPFSDQQIAERLQEAGLRISRRTVAKYREEMGIAPSSKRMVR